MADQNEIVGVVVQVDTSSVQSANAIVEQLTEQLRIAEENAAAIGKATGTANRYYQDAVTKVAELKAQLESAAQSGNRLGDGANRAIAPVQSLRAQIREAKANLDAVNQAFGETSQEAIAAAKQLANLKDRFGDLNAQADAFNPDKKLAAFGQAAQGVVGGFTAIQGVMALLGSDSENLQKALLKVQAALAISQGLNSIFAAKDGFTNLIAVVKSLTIVQTINAAVNRLTAATFAVLGITVEATSVAFTVLKAAIVTTGIGVLVVGIGIAIQALSSFSSGTRDAAKAQDELNKKLIEGADDLKSRMLALEKSAEDTAVARAQAEGKSEEYITGIHQRAAASRLQILKDYRKSVDSDATKSKEANDALQTEANKQETDRYNKITAANKKTEEAAKKHHDKLLADSKTAKDKRDALLKAALAAEQSAVDETFALHHTAEEKEQFELSRKFADRIKAYEAVGKDTTALVEQYNGDSDAIYQKARNKEIKDTEELYKKKLETLKQGFQEQEDATNAYYDAVDEAQKEHPQGFDNQISQAQFERDLEIGQVRDHYQQLQVLSQANYQRLQDLAKDNVAEQARLKDEQTTEQNKQANEQNEKQQAIEQKYANKRVAIAQAEKDAKTAVLQATSAALSNFAELLGQQTLAGKLLAIASATINTYVAASEALKAKIPFPEPFATAIRIANVASTIALGLEQVKKIAKVEVPGGGGGGGGANVAAPAGGGAPLQPSPTTQLTAIDAQSVNSLNNKTVKTYVVQTDLQGQQDRIDRINNDSTFK